MQIRIVCWLERFLELCFSGFGGAYTSMHDLLFWISYLWRFLWLICGSLNVKWIQMCGFPLSGFPTLDHFCIWKCTLLYSCFICYSLHPF